MHSLLYQSTIKVPTTRMFPCSSQHRGVREDGRRGHEHSTPFHTPTRAHRAHIPRPGLVASHSRGRREEASREAQKRAPLPNSGRSAARAFPLQRALARLGPARERARAPRGAQPSRQSCVNDGVDALSLLGRRLNIGHDHSTVAGHVERVTAGAGQPPLRLDGVGGEHRGRRRRRGRDGGGGGWFAVRRPLAETGLVVPPVREAQFETGRRVHV